MDPPATRAAPAMIAAGLALGASRAPSGPETATVMEGERKTAPAANGLSPRLSCRYSDATKIVAA